MECLGGVDVYEGLVVGLVGLVGLVCIWIWVSAGKGDGIGVAVWVWDCEFLGTLCLFYRRVGVGC